MNKQEFVHVHGLLVQLARHLVDRGAIPGETVAEYDALGTKAHSVHASKEDHQEAVQFLAAAIETGLEQRAEDRSSVAVQ